MKKQLLLLLLLCLIFRNSYSQDPRHDYVLIGDTLHTDLKILGRPDQKGNTINVRYLKSNTSVELGIAEVTEFSYKNNKFIKKNLGDTADPRWNFLELIPTQHQQLVLYRLNSSPKLLFLEEDGKLFPVERDFRTLLKEKVRNPYISELISITKNNVGSITYLLNRDQTTESPFILLRQTYIHPTIAFGSLSQHVELADFDIDPLIQGKITSVGINFENFVNKKRTLSLNLNPQYFITEFQQFKQVDMLSQGIYEMDISHVSSGYNIHISAKGYLEIWPQHLRAYIEPGFQYGSVLAHQSYQLGSLVKGNEISYHSKSFEIEKIHNGPSIGFGVEKSLSPKGRIIGLGGRYSGLRSPNGFTFKTTQISATFKF
jgi:hypothetical protein